MTPNETIYIINQSPALTKAWRELSENQKRLVIKECERVESEDEIELIIEEIVEGQRRLF
jgi:hypothetical protein